ncbi:MAG TPA: hypothetical protein VFT45_04960 [Longimicrobium sp.]|nr:hypothetical protein [Longimicrobium sp.]
MRRWFLSYLEIWLSAVGVAVILFLPSLVGVSRENYWYVTALVAITVGVVHGLIFWSVHRRQRYVRDRTVAQVRAMLRDDIHKQVAALLTMDAQATDRQRMQLDGVFDSMILLDHMLESLSTERLRVWTGSEEGRIEMDKGTHPSASSRSPDLHVHRDTRN